MIHIFYKLVSTPEPDAEHEVQIIGVVEGGAGQDLNKLYDEWLLEKCGLPQPYYDMGVEGFRDAIAKLNEARSAASFEKFRTDVLWNLGFAVVEYQAYNWYGAK